MLIALLKGTSGAYLQWAESVLHSPASCIILSTKESQSEALFFVMRAPPE